MATDPNAVDADDVQVLREVGLDDQQIFAVTAYVALRLAFSTVNDALGAGPDQQLGATALPAVTAFLRVLNPTLQVMEAIAKATARQSFVVTTGTGSGKSLCFFIPIIDAAIRARAASEAPPTRAIVIYPMNALASRTVSMNEQLHNPPWANEWIVDQAKRHRIDAALVLTPLGTRPSATGNRFIEMALERAGIPVLPIFADMVDSRSWDAAGMRRQVAQFLEQRAL